MKRILAGIVLIVILTEGATAGPVEDGLDAYRRGDYEMAERLWRPLAEQGLAEAQYDLGVMFYEVSQDYAEHVL